jgi:hypothetical protein
MSTADAGGVHSNTTDYLPFPFVTTWKMRLIKVKDVDEINSVVCI